MIFISYRRDDSLSETGRLYDRLEKRFGEEAIFRDIDSIPYGTDFVEYIEGVVAKCTVALVVVGRDWITDRLNDENDFVRVEIEAAFRHGLTVIPVFVDKAKAPKAQQIPDSLARLPRMHGLELDSGRDFNVHVDRLIARLERIFAEQRDAAARHELEAQQRKEADAARQKEAEAAQRQEADAVRRRELEAARRLEAEAARRLEAEAARRLEAEAARRLEAEAARRLEAEAARRLEAEAARRLEAEAARRLDAQAAWQQEAEAARQRNADGARREEAEAALRQVAEKAQLEGVEAKQLVSAARRRTTIVAGVSTLVLMSGGLTLCSLEQRKSPTEPDSIVVDKKADPATPTTDADQATSPIPITSADPQWGDSLAPVTLVEFSDFQCPFCARVQPTLKQLRETYGADKLRIVWKNLPLAFHQQARPAAIAAMAAFSLGGSDAFWKFHDQAFANQSALSQESFIDWATTSGLSRTSYGTMLDDPRAAEKVDGDVSLFAKLGMRPAAPTFRINGLFFSGAQPFERFKAVIDWQLKQAEEETRKGVPAEALYVVLSKRFLEADVKELVPQSQ